MTRLVPIRDLAAQVRGVTYKAAEASTTPQNDTVGVVRAGNITDGELTTGDLVYVPASRVAEKQWLKQGDVLVATSSGSLDVVGKAARIRRDEEVAFGAFCKVLRPSPDVDSGYFAHFFQTKTYRRHVTRVAAGSNINNLKGDDLDNIQLRLPPIEEQRRIAAVLDAAEGLRAKRRQALAKLDNLTQALFLGMFGDPSNHRSTVRASIGSVAAVVTGNTPPRSDLANFGAHVEWLKTNNIRESGEIECASEFLSESGRAKGREAPAGASLVVCIAGSPRSIGRVGFLDRPAAFNQQINAVVPGPSLRALFLFHQLRAAQRLIQRASTNSMKGMVSKSALAAVEILVPPLSDQDGFVEVVERISRVRELASRSLAATDTLFASLQQRAFRGEL